MHIFLSGFFYVYECECKCVSVDLEEVSGEAESAVQIAPLAAA